MRACSYAKIDYLRCKTQIRLLFAMMLVFSIFFTLQTDSIGFAVGYLTFLSVIFATAPFGMDQRSESGFINMLPGSAKDKVYGRYLYIVCGVLITIVVAVASVLVLRLRGNEIDEASQAGYIALIGVAFIVIAIESVILYAVGKGKSQQYIALIQMLPAFAMFFGGSMLVEYLSEHDGFDFTWIIEHKMPLAFATLAIGFVVFLLSSRVSLAIVKRKDYE